MREQRVGVSTFVPLDTVKAKPIDEQYRRIQNAKLIIDVISFESNFEKAMRYAVGNTLVVESMDEARKLSFDNSQRTCYKGLFNVNIF